ncbi:MAG: glycerate kinase [Planctomycetes bacterium]|nr:glycerate kinase [Planctomycetota bacterium]
MRIVVAPDSFKEALSARQVCEAVACGIRRARPDATIDLLPMADGGEGTVDALVAATNGQLRESTVTGPLGKPVQACWGLLGDGSATAVLEMAAASGLGLVPSDSRNPLLTTTFGTGQLIAAALDSGVRRILIGIGGSATNDGGTGAAQAVGVRFVDRNGRVLPNGLSGGQLGLIAGVDLASRDPRIGRVPIEAACDVDNPLCGPGGAAAVYGPQKGADPESVRILDANLAHMADVIERDLGKDVRDIPGAGAAGGLGAGLPAFFDAKLRPGIQMVMEALRFSERIADADLIITGEGRLDRQSMMGKLIEGIGRAAKSAGVPVIALVGSAGQGADDALEVLQSYHCINPANTPPAEALPQTATRLEQTAARLLLDR